MASITKTYTIPSELVSEMIEVFSQGYEATVDGEANPQTKNQYASEQFDATVNLAIRRKVVDYRKRSIAVDNEFNLT